MSTIKKDGKENNNRRMSGISREGKPSVAASIKTPSKSTRYNLGSASKYYFKYVNSSAKKKPKTNTSFGQEDDPDFYLKAAFRDEDDTGNLSLLSIPEMAGKTNNSSLDTSVLSLGDSSSSSEESNLLNKSTLSDTTELTASNFVLAATSRQKMREISLDNSVWTKKATTKPINEQLKPAAEQPPSARKPLGNKQSTENTSKIRATLSQDSAGTAAATPSNRRLSMRGASPSLRSRISASPKSLRKFTEDLKNSRIQRQMQREVDAKKNAAANSALLNSSVASVLNSSLLLDGSELSVTKKKRSRSSMAPRHDKRETSMMSNSSEDSTDDILGAMDEIFGMVNSDENTETLSQQPKRSSVTATPSAVDEALSQEPKKVNSRRDSSPGMVAYQRSRRSSGFMERPLLLDEHKEEAASDTVVESSNDNEKKATPSKLAPTPQPPRLLDSPARNTRSAKKRSIHIQNDDTVLLGDLGDILGGVSDSMSVKASKEGETEINDSPMEENVRSRPSFGSEEKSESNPGDETAPIDIVGDILSQLTQDSSGEQDKDITEQAGRGDMKSPAASISQKDISPQQRKPKEGTTPKKGASTPQRIENPRLLDSPARNTRNAKKRQSYSTSGDTESIAALGIVLETDDEKPSTENSNEHQKTESPAIGNLLTQRSVGSEEKGGMSDGGDATETASIGDLGSIFGLLTQETTDSKQDEDIADHGGQGDTKSPTASVSHKGIDSPQIESKEGTTLRKGASTPQRIENPRLLDSPARNTRNAKKRQSYSTAADAESIAALGNVLETDDEKPSTDDSIEHQKTESPAIENLLTQRSVGSEEKGGMSDGGDATETASIGDLGSIFGLLTQETTDSKQDEDIADHGGQGDTKSPTASVSHKGIDSPQIESKEGTTPTKLANTPERMGNPRLLDSPARNTRSGKKRQSYSTAGDAESTADLEGALRGDDEKPSSRNSSPPAIRSLLTQRSVGSEEKSNISDGGDVTETAAIGDLGSIFGGLTQESVDNNSPMAPRQTYLGNEDSPVTTSAMESNKTEAKGISDEDGARAGSDEDTEMPDHSIDHETSPKLAPTPQRMENPRLLDSPARNTRSAKKRMDSANGEETTAVASLGDALERSSEAVDDISKSKLEEIQSPSQDDLIPQQSFGSEEKGSTASEKDDDNETASVGDIGDILGVLPQAEASTSPSHPVDSTAVDSPPRLDRNSMKENGFDRFETLNHNDSLLSTSSAAQSEAPGPNASFSSPKHDLGQDSSLENSSHPKSKVSETKPTAPQRIENPRLLDSPARNTRSAKKNQREVELEDTSNHTASIADLSDIFGDSVKGFNRDTSVNYDKNSSPSESINLSQRSFGSAEKSDLQEDVTDTGTASLGDIRDILGGLSSTTQSGKDNHSMKEMSEAAKTQHSSPSETNFLSQRSFGSEEKSIKSKDESEGDNTETASIGDIGDILGGLIERAADFRSPTNVLQASGANIDSPRTANRTVDSEETELESSFNGLDEKQNASKADELNHSEEITASKVAVDQSTPPPSPSRSTENGQPFSGFRTRATPTKLAPTPQRIPNPRLFDSPARNTRSAKKRPSYSTARDAESIADLGSVLWTGDEKPSTDYSGELRSTQSPPISNMLTQRSVGSEEKADISDGGDATETASIGDLGSIFGGLTQESTDSKQDEDITEHRDQVHTNSQAPSVSHKDVDSQRIKAKESTTPAKLASNKRSAKKQKGNSSDVDTGSLEDLNVILSGSGRDSRDDTKGQNDSPSKSRVTSQRAFGSGNKSTTSSTDREEETETASLEDIGDILGGPRKDPGQSSRKSANDESADRSSSLSSSEKEEQKAFASEQRLSGERGGATPTAKAAKTVVFENPRLLDSPARSTRSAKRKHRENDDTNSSTTSIPSAESHDENSSSSQQIQLTQESFGSDLSRDDENDTRTTASMEEINSILFELAQQAPVDGSPTAELNPIMQNYDESRDISRLQDATEAFNVSHMAKASREGPEQLDNSNMSMSSAGEDTTMHSSSVSASSRQTRFEGTPTKLASTQKSSMRLTPNSHVKPTPTKIKPSPRRVLNPMSIYSPARKTRSAKKAAEEQSTANEQHHREESKRKMQPYNSEDLRSPMPKKFKPVGILSSMKRRRRTDTGASQRTISFGSPEAALYHVGSPSGSFTPLPRSRAKELFAIPRNNASASSSDESREETVGIESNLHILVDKISADNMEESPELSPIANDQDSSRIQNFSISGEKSVNETEDTSDGNEHTAELEVCMEELLENAGEGTKVETEHTVALEPAMEQVLANAMHSRPQSPKTDGPLLNDESQGSMDTQDSSPANSSVDLADNRSIASMNARSEKYTSEFKMAAMEAQKLDFSTQTSQSDSDDSMDVDEENTIPLEVDMTSLLAAAGNPSKKQEIADTNEDAEANESSESSPESPVASTRFSLSKEDSPETIEVVDKLMASKGEDVAFSTANANESQIGSSEEVSQEFVDEPYTLTLDDLYEIGDLKSSPEASEGSQDSVLKFSAIVEKMDSFALSRWNQFLKAVCDEVEKQDQDLDGQAASAYNNILNEQQPHMRRLEAILRSQEGSDTEANIRALVRANKDSVEAEWNDWLKNLLEAFSSEWLVALSNDLKKDMTMLDTISELGEQALTKIAAMKDEKVHRARRKSLSRRKSLTRSLDDEIRELEAQLEQAKTELDEMKEKESAMDAKIVELEEVRALENEAKTHRTDAAPSQKAYMSLRGLHSWNPSTMNDSNLAFEAVGQYAQTSNTITYNLEGSSIDTTVSRDESSLDTMQYVSKSASTMIDYLSTCADEHAKSVRQKGVSSTTEIGTSMQSYMWNLGRMDQTVTELQSLKKRYNSMFSKQGDKFVFSVEFKNSSTSLRAEFDMDHLYPALPLEVQLSLIKGDIDLDRVRRSLRKSAKPGFGNLSRACAVISAFVPPATQYM